MKKFKILVTGGEGFVGYHMCKKLLEVSNEITSLDINLANRDDRKTSPHL